jgi:hypothetical protein
VSLSLLVFVGPMPRAASFPVLFSLRNSLPAREAVGLRLAARSMQALSEVQLITQWQYVLR